MTAISRVVLFDIDGTLIHSGRAGVRGLNAAFLSLYGVAGALDRVALAGRTDRAIVSEALRNIGRDPTAETIAAVREAYVDHLAIEVKKPVPGSRVLPGVSAVLDALAGRADVKVGLLTGNFQRGAAIKLGHFELWSRFAFGAFGDDHVDRRDLVPIAMAEAGRAGAVVPASQIVVVGDTPADVDCARAHGACAVAVATGPFSRADLESSRPDVLIDTLEDRDSFLAWLGRG